MSSLSMCAVVGYGFEGFVDLEFRYFFFKKGFVGKREDFI